MTNQFFMFYKIFGYLYAFIYGLKSSNFIIGRIQFSIDRLNRYIKNIRIDLYLSISMTETAEKIKSMGKIVCLDTHNILWQSYKAY